MLANYRMAQPTQWAPAILDYMKNLGPIPQLICETEPSEI